MVKPKFQIGQIVRVRGLTQSNQDDWPGIMLQMVRLSGSVGVIGLRFYNATYDQQLYRLAGIDYTWRSDWLEPVERRVKW